jgi:hypothetical protein
MHTIFWLENVKDRYLSGNLGVKKRIILKWILGETVYEGVVWIHLA